MLIDGAPVSERTTPRALIRLRADALEQRTVKWRPGTTAEPRTVTLHDLGVRVDEDLTFERAMRVGRSRGLAYRLNESWQARAGLVDIPLAWHIEPSTLLDELTQNKESEDRLGVPSRFDFSTRSVIPHRPGSFLDPFATLDALDHLVRAGGTELNAAYSAVPPIVTAAFLHDLDMSQRVGHYETRFGYLGGQADRAQNIRTAAEKLDGVVVLPDQVLSFNEIVGHRTLDNGFKKGWEIFRGEMVEGVGGGTCQVASTLHAAAYLSGMDIIDRSPHSRPSGYIPLGLDATVVDGLVDLKLRNSFSFPVVVHSIVDKGQLSFELLGQQRPVQVTFRGDVVRTQRYKRKISEAHWLPTGRIIRKQKGISGYTVRKVRTIRARSGLMREEVTTDVYPPTVEVFLVPPGTDPEADLPPLPFADNNTDPDEPSDAERTDRPVIEDAPTARTAASPPPATSVVIDR
jgi:vancomycin resistance protein YoaR